jgi:hypothetical protein
MRAISSTTTARIARRPSSLIAAGRTSARSIVIG